MIDNNSSNKPKIICFFAHKGGVSKTTNLYHLGWMMASHFNQHVLLVDADPQCNLTHALVKEASSDPDYRDSYPRGNIYGGIAPIHNGTKDPEMKNLLPVDCIQITRATSESGGKLFLMPGSLKLSQIEPQLTFAHQNNMPEEFPLFHNVAGAFRNLFEVTASFYYCSYVLIDMGPSIGELNKNLFFSSDFFVIPCSPDAYCRSTIVTMNEILPKQYKTHRRLASVTCDQSMPVKPQPAKYIGTIMSLYNVTGKEHKPVKQAQRMMYIVEQEIINTLLPTLEELQMNGLCEQSPIISKIPHFLQLMQMCQRAFSPVYALPKDMLWDLDNEGNLKEMSESEKQRNLGRAMPYFDMYKELANIVIESVNDSNFSMGFDKNGNNPRIDNLPAY